MNCIINQQGETVIIQEGWIFYCNRDTPRFIGIYDQKDPLNPFLWQNENEDTSEMKEFSIITDYFDFQQLIRLIAQLSGFQAEIFDSDGTVVSMRISL